MNLKEQQYIVTLAGCGSMTQAAKKLNITQPALSSYLAGVENSLGYPLFERTGKALRPTYLGELYLEKARKILALGEEFQQQREQVLHGYQGRIRVGIPIRRSPHLIPSALKIFRSRFPNVEVVVQEGNQRAMTEMLREDQLDLMLCNLVNQEGELEYDPRVLGNVFTYTVDDPAQLTPELFKKLEKQYRPKQVIIEYNGMWMIEPLYRDGLPANWILYQIMCLVDARSFEMYVKNMGQLMMEKISNADMLIFNHCNEELRAQLRSRNLRMVNRRADIYLENEDGTSEEYVTPEMSPFDLSDGHLEVPDEDRGKH